MDKTRAEHDHRSFQRRLEVLRLPVVPLKFHAELQPRHPQDWKYEPEAVGVGPDGTAFAVWPHRRNAGRKRVTSHIGSDIITSVDVTAGLETSFVQPLPGWPHPPGRRANPTGHRAQRTGMDRRWSSRPYRSSR